MSTTALFLILIALALGGVGGYFLRNKLLEMKVKSAEDEAQRIMKEAEREAERIKKEAILEAKETIYKEKASRCEVVVCLPESAIDAAYGFHEESGLRWEMALRRHRYVSQRAFITDGVDRQTVIYRKLNILAPKIVGKRVAVVDDSIVRGDTMRGNVRRLRDAGAREVHLFITFPRRVGPCFYGIDMSTYGELIGSRLDEEQVAEELGADSVNYMPVEEYVKELGLRRDQLCLGCVTNEYPTPEANRIASEIRKRLQSGGSERGRVYE